MSSSTIFIFDHTCFFSCCFVVFFCLFAFRRIFYFESHSYIERWREIFHDWFTHQIATTARAQPVQSWGAQLFFVFFFFPGSTCGFRGAGLGHPTLLFQAVHTELDQEVEQRVHKQLSLWMSGSGNLFCHWAGPWPRALFSCEIFIICLIIGGIHGPRLCNMTP